MTQSTFALGQTFQAAANHFGSGNFSEAHNLCHQILGVDPHNADALHLLAFIAWQSNSKTQAIELLQKAVAARPEDPELISNLGSFYKELGQRDLALNCFLKACSVDPNSFLAHFNLGVTLVETSRLTEAIQAYERAIAIRPDMSVTYNNLATAYSALGRFTEARDSLRRAVALDEKYLEAHFNLAMIESHLGESKTAVESFQKAISLKPDCPELYKYLGDVLSNTGQHQQAIETHRKALTLRPNYYESLLGMAASYSTLCMTNEAIATYRQAQELNPQSLVPLWGSCMSYLQSSYRTADDIPVARKQYEQALANIESRLLVEDANTFADANALVGALQPFYLASQGYNDKELQQKYGSIVNKIMSKQYPQWSQPLPLKAIIPGERIRVGFVSRYFQHHANWKILLGGWAEGLDHKSFKLYGYRTGGVNDDVTARARELFDVLIEGNNFEQLCHQIKQDDLHVLIYPENGMDPLSVRLAALRLAPVQCVSWGHPNTSGLPTIDYFLSSDLMEPDNGQDFYTEKLVRLPNLSSYYMPLSLAPKTDRLESLGVRNDAIRYLCLQSMHKYLPQYDMVFPKIAQKVPNAQFIFVVNLAGADTIFKERIEQAFAHFGMNWEQYVTFLPMLSNEEYRGLCSQGHVFLDTFEWSGCTTTLEALEQKLVPVTLPGSSMRARHTAAFLTMMDVTETIANTLDQYIDIAVRLGLDSTFRQTVKQEIERKHYLLYRDSETISALEDFLRSCGQLPN